MDYGLELKKQKHNHDTREITEPDFGKVVGSTVERYYLQKMLRKCFRPARTQTARARAQKFCPPTSGVRIYKLKTSTCICGFKFALLKQMEKNRRGNLHARFWGYYNLSYNFSFFL